MKKPIYNRFQGPAGLWDFICWISKNLRGQKSVPPSPSSWKVFGAMLLGSVGDTPAGLMDGMTHGMTPDDGMAARMGEGGDVETYGGGFPKMVGFPNNHGLVFLLKMIILGVFWGYQHLRKHHMVSKIWIICAKIWWFSFHSAAEGSGWSLHNRFCAKSDRCQIETDDI